MKKRYLLRAAEIVGLVGAGIYTFFAAYAFALRDNLYWLFAILALIALFSSLGISSLIRRFPLDEKKKRIEFFVASIASVVTLIPLILCLLAYRLPDEGITDFPEKEKKEAKKRPWYKSARFIVSVVSLGLIGISAFTGSLFETTGFAVSVTDFRLTKKMTEDYNLASRRINNDDVSYAVTFYQPKFASPENKVSTIFVIPGFTRTKATMSQYAIELSKRGCAVFVIDPGSQGGSTNAGYDENGDQLSYAAQANGAVYLVDYVYNNVDAFPNLDRNRFGVMGHSAGGGNAVTVASEFAGANFAASKIKALYISGYIKVTAAAKYKEIRCNAANAYAYYDEGAFRYQSDSTSLEVINSRFINEVNGATLDRAVEYDTPYGSMEDGTYRILHREKTNHCFEMYDGLSITNSIAFFRECFNLSTTLPDSSHTWILKEGSNGIALVAGMTFLCAIAGLLIELPFLRLAKGKKIVEASNGEYCYEDEVEKHVEPKKPSAIPSRFSFKGKSIFWFTTVFSFVLACLDYIPLAYLSMKMFPDAANNIFTGVFPARMFNAVLLWAAFNGVIGLILFFGVQLVENLVERVVAKKEGRDPVYDWSKFLALKISWKGILVTLGLAVILFLIFYGLIGLSYVLFHQDFRFTLISASPLSLRFFVTWLEYFPIIFLFYISNSIKVNCSLGQEGWSEWKVYLVGSLSNCLALVFILIINYVAFFKTGTPFYGYFGEDKQEIWLYVNMVFALTPMMALLPIVNRIFYRWTNRVYLGALVSCMVFVMMSLSATISFIPVA